MWFRARPFGSHPTDLDVDFQDRRTPFLVTRLLVGTLVRCDGEAFPEVEVWQWTVARRLQGLLAVAIATSGRELTLQLNCRRPACREFMELAVDLLQFGRVAAKGSFAFRPAPETEIGVRLPTGDDQRYWLEHALPEFSPAFLARRLVTRVAGEAAAEDWTLPEVWVASIGRLLERHDPLVDLRLETRCPSCGAELAIELDLEPTLLDGLAHEQRRLLDQIHCLASVYHWSEADIVALPPLRRRYYLDRLTPGAAQ